MDSSFLLKSIVKTLADNISIPVFVKIRLLNTVPETITLCEQLVAAGASLIAIHARYRVSLVGRTGPGARDGAAHLEQVAEIRRAIPRETIIIANGNIRCVGWVGGLLFGSMFLCGGLISQTRALNGFFPIH